MVRREILRRVIAPYRNTRFSSFLLGFLSKKNFSKKLFTEPIVWFLVITSKANTLRRKRNESK